MACPVVPAEPEPADRLSDADRMEAAEEFFAKVGAQLRHGGTRAFYAPALDAIAMPPFATFESPASYYATLGHEHIHWTGHSRRLDRLEKTPKASEPYAREELVAELGAAFLCADLGISHEPREDHASYLASWLKVLRDDKRAIVTAASAAQRAANFLHEKAGALLQADEATAA